ncbi:MAG: sensor domain-containing diguanylate cyclase [Pleomorphochaeta sp.]
MKSLQMLSEIALLNFNTSNFNYQMNKVLKIIGEYTNVSRTYIFIDNENGSETKNEFEWCNKGISAQINNFQILKYKDIPSLKKYLITKEKLFANDIRNLPKDITDILSPQKIKSIIIYPLEINNKLKGFIGFDECKILRKWKKNEINIIATLSGIISNIYNNYYYSLKIEEDKQYFENFFNTITDYIIVCNKNGEIVYANQATITNLEYSINELVHMNIIDFIVEQDKNRASRIYNLMFKGKIKSSSFNFKSKSGRVIPAETRIWSGKWNNQDCIFGIAKDMTKEKEALLKFTKVFQNNPALMALSDMEDMRFIDVNTSFVEKLGYSYDELIGKTTDELKLFPNPEKHKAIAVQLSKKGTIKNIELEVRQKDGSILYGLFSGEIIESENKNYFLTVMIDITEKRKMEQKIKEQSIRDSLTNLYNRRYIFDQLEIYLYNYKKKNDIFSITILDIDFFKEINDTYGHIIGDHILIQLTKMISSKLDDTNFFGRYGGEEFIIVSLNKDKNDTKNQICNILKETRETTFNIKNHKIKLTFSAGISDSMCIEKETSTVEKIINIADERLYKAKKTGRNKVVIL